MEKLPVYIITGLSGSGKSTAMQAFEDASFYCVDNMPISLVPKFLELPFKEDPAIKGIAFVMDVRSKNFISHYASGITAIEEIGIQPEIIFLEADIDTLLKRFSQTRRLHPISGERSLRDSIVAESQRMQRIKSKSHYVIDTSRSNVHQLKSKILDFILKGPEKTNLMKLNILSFGFKYGLPSDADMVIDMRFLPNPYFVPELKKLDGESEGVRQFVLACTETQDFLDRYLDLLDYLIPLYKRENKAYFTIAVGCTGGRHRSVVVARAIFEHLNGKGLFPGIIHRDIDRDAKEI